MASFVTYSASIRVGPDKEIGGNIQWYVVSAKFGQMIGRSTLTQLCSLVTHYLPLENVSIFFVSLSVPPVESILT